MSVDLKDTQIDPNSDRYRTMLENLQGNILKGHGRDFTIHIFLKFTARVSFVKPWIRNFTQQFVTSARQQLEETNEFKAFGIPGTLFANFFLSSQGYEYILELSQDQLARRFPPEVTDPIDPNVKFINGMEAAQAELNDPSPQTWEAGYRGRQIHAMILLADDDEQLLLRRARQVLSQVRAVGRVLAIERGRALRNETGLAIEHFGYADGVSQPLFLQSDLDRESQQAGGIDKWNPAAPLNLALIKDPNVRAEDCFGSYFVFRKLEQNVRGFKQREEELAEALGFGSEEEKERAGALVVGRFEDGTPVVLEKVAPATPANPPINNFKYDLDDPSATKCPFHAHIRKTNPRGDVAKNFGVDEEQAERSRRIVRRGITYGERKDDLESDDLNTKPTKDVGLLFMCFQSSIPHQFGFMQKSWANNVDFVKPGTGRDPVIGQKGNDPAVPQTWSQEWGGTNTKQFDFGDFVTLKGGEFFFAPSIPFLLKL